MAPEALHAYLIGKGFDEDVAQDVIVRYLTAKEPIRYPTSWAWKTAIFLRLNARRDEGLIPFTSDVTDELRTHDPSPLARAETRQALSRAVAGLPPDAGLTTKGKSRLMKVYKPGRPRGGGVKAWREDYQALCREGD